MHDPEFEKQVQEKMKELEFAPPAGLWKKLEEELKKEKKRKIPLFWFFLLGGSLLLLVGGYEVLLSGKKSVVDHGVPVLAKMKGLEKPARAGEAESLEPKPNTNAVTEAKTRHPRERTTFASRSEEALIKPLERKNTRTVTAGPTGEKRNMAASQSVPFLAANPG